MPEQTQTGIEDVMVNEFEAPVNFNRPEIEEKPHEECGVVVVIARDEGNVAKYLYEGLYGVKNRGHDALGALAYGKHGFVGVKGLGEIEVVLPEGAGPIYEKAPNATIAIGHVRYSTVSKENSVRDQEAILPWQDEAKEFAGSMNGNVINALDIARAYGISPEDCPSDAVAILRTIHKRALELEDPIAAIKEIAPQLKGAYCIAIAYGNKVIGFRDPHGIRPFSIGRTLDGGLMLASETKALDLAGAEYIRDIKPGEIVEIDQADPLLEIKSHWLDVPKLLKFCGLEVAYLMDPESRLSGYRVADLRYRLGQALAEEFKIENPEEYIVVGVPDSGIFAAKGFADALGIPYRQLIVKNEDQDTHKRSFLASTQEERQQISEDKLYIYEDEVIGKKIITIDDSVVRGNVLAGLNRRLREAGAQEIRNYTPFPMILHGCHQGVASKTEDLLTFGRTFDEMVAYVSSPDHLGYISQNRYVATLSPLIGGLCMGCIDGDYPVPLPVAAARQTE
ncbi:MAG: amidophosphoribosyltransferase [Candidatus Saccharibacteria bacterium]|nr:amidophosphoribosyltransferase [Candidatus Saccharibacteria bacterium]